MSAAIQPAAFGATEFDWMTAVHVGQLTSDLLPVVSNPHATISPKSSLKGIGKTPSLYNAAGQVIGFKDWSNFRATSEDIEQWRQVPDYGICIQARRVRAIDVDVDDSTLAAQIEATISVFMGTLPRRGRANSTKFLVGFLLPGAYTKRVIETRAGRIEFLADGQQFIAHGTHPSGARYEWTNASIGFAAREPANFEALWAALQVYAAPNAAPSGSGAPISDLVKNARKLDDTWFEPLSDDQKIAEARAIAATWSVQQATQRDPWFKCIRSIADAVDRGLEREAGVDIATEFSQRSTGATDDRAAVEAKMFEGGDKPSIYAAAAIAHKFGYRIPPNRSATPPPPNAMPIPPDAYKSLEDRSGQGNANLLIRLADGNLRYVAETKQWLRWIGTRWQIDTHETFVTSHALEVGNYYLQQARVAKSGTWRHDANGNVELADDLYKWGVKCRNKAAIDEMITLARKVPGVPISITELDRDPWLLGVENGVVDLRTGVLREAEAREDYVTKRCPLRYDPAARAPRWELLIVEATGSPLPVDLDEQGNVIPKSVGQYTPRPALARYLHKALGYSLTGETREQKLFIPLGDGSNAKGIVFDAAKDILGPYAVTIPSDAIMATKFDADSERPTALAATLAGARFVVASETREGQKLNVALVKAHTGDRQMTARRMRENPFTFNITHKLWLLSNHRPVIEHMDDAIKGRLHLIPFDRQWNRPGVVDHNPALPDGDKGLAVTLKGEYEGVLAWLVRGAVLYHREGLTPPDEVTGKTREYVLEQDHLGRWLSMLTKCKPAHGTKASVLFAKFGDWCLSESRRTDPATQTAFSKALGKRGFVAVVRADGSYYGLLLTPGVSAIPPPPNSYGVGRQPLPPGAIPAPR